MRIRQTLFAIGMAAAAAACSETTSPTVPTSDPPFELLAVSPVIGQTLPRGAVTSVSLTVESDFPGRLTLSIRDQSRAPVYTSEPPFDLVAGRPTTIEVFFAVPDAASSIDVLGEFRPEAAGSPAAVSVQYPVR
jgi:hypothetical protein